MPQNHIPGTSRKLARRLVVLIRKNAPAAILPFRRLAERAFYPVRILAKIAVGDAMTVGPVDIRTAPGLDIVELGCSSHHQHGLTPLAGITVQVAGIRHRPFSIGLRPAHLYTTTSSIKMSAPELLGDSLQFGQIAKERVGCKTLDPVGPLIRFVDAAPDMSPELLAPRVHQVRTHKSR